MQYAAGGKWRNTAKELGKQKGSAVHNRDFMQGFQSAQRGHDKIVDTYTAFWYNNWVKQEVRKGNKIGFNLAFRILVSIQH